MHYSVKWSSNISDVDREAWNSIAIPLQTPFLEWEWLHQLEASGSITPRHGWLPMHLTIWRENTLLAAAPLYIKGHSSGEFVYDYIWVDVAQQLGVKYYPKLIGMIPATPSVGYRFLTAPGENEAELTDVMLEEIDKLCKKNDITGVAFNFADEDWLELMSRYSFNTWKHQSFLWENQGFTSFADYLAVFNKNQRRNILRERASMADQGITIRALHGDEISDRYLSIMYHYYDKTNDQFGMWAARYLNRRFFEGMSDYRHRLLLVAAFPAEAAGKSDPDPVAMSFLVHKEGMLVGRYWGTEQFFDNLHFNVCYYAPIEWAIANGVKYFDPGAGSTHKIRRGFRAVSNFSLHRFYDQRLHYIMAANIERVNTMEQSNIDELNEGLPFAEHRRVNDS
ncbi:MAG TPA: GNAT family N-acetyltransferase [Spirochaetia bacterium]|nr:GNAT family N-acetyltransferase [Spirochaetia bacterium]